MTEDWRKLARAHTIADLPMDEIVARVGVDADKSYVHIQTNLSSFWAMTHNMGRIPSVSVYDTAGSRWHPDITHGGPNVSYADFGAVLVAGNAYFD